MASPKPGPKTRTSNPLVRQATVIGLFAAAAVLGVVSGVLFAYSPDLPEISDLDDYAPSTITRVYARGGEVIGEFATERRVIIGYDDIPEVLRNAIISAEDSTFFEHVGFSIPRIVVTIIRDVLRQELRGASTLTQQLARRIAIGGETLGGLKTLQRKIKEAYYTFHIEKRYTKREILTLYCNQIYWGSGAYGVEAAARIYFGKSAKDLELEEAAVIAGIIQTPSRQSPLVNMQRATSRRNYVLQRMADEGYITQEQATASMSRPIQLARRTRRTDWIAPYFVEEVRQHLEREYGARRLYEDGLVVRSTLDVNLQRIASRAVSDGLRALDKRRGFRTPTRNVLAEGENLEEFQHDRWSYTVNPGDIVPAVVTSVDDDTMWVRFAGYTADIGAEDRITEDGFAWTRPRPGAPIPTAAELVKPGDLVEVAITALPDDAGQEPAEVALDQEPEVEVALLALENRTGRVLAMVGGFDFERSKFNRATQAYRQLGSLFKGVLYAAAIDQGYTTTSIVLDEPVSYDVGPDQDYYEPVNHGNVYEGPIPLRRALEKSRNVSAVWLMNEIGPETVIDFARRLGFTSAIPPFLSVALGSAEATLTEVTNAYSVFPNGGIRMTPYQIERILDREGHTLEETHPVPQDALRADTAYIMVTLLRGVVERGTGIRAAWIPWPLGGKTGTMDEYTDAWFVGFDPEITVGVWVGYDTKRTLGEGEEGSRVALPIWMEFIQDYIAGRPAPEGFVPPANIVFTSVDPLTGEVTEPWAHGAIQEAFIAGTEPGTAFRR